ncbi:hypothetical protein NC653_040698 [Populus alba x Populus x berolinensis]|uniref:Uncharacterized protein n=1 Tax=Populus alba x Populus x berolinensis TaxID=444605 RepID=A0AAD6L6Q1_9ROSI|nr:hypothetical protein NC653_040698 [Populus alba x Populus x berolinensis]
MKKITLPLKMISRETNSLAAPKRLRYCFLHVSFKVGRSALVSVIMFSRSNIRVLGFLPDLQGWVLSGSSPSTLCAVVDNDLAVEA